MAVRAEMRPSADEVLAVVATYRLDIPPLHDFAAETMALPSMTGIFQRLAFDGGGYPPAPEEFLAAFFDAYTADRRELMRPRRGVGIRARLLRAYASFVREHHLTLSLREDGLLCLRSPRLDQELGVDILVVGRDAVVGLATYVDTPRARAARRTKARWSQTCVLDVPLCIDGALRAGDLLLYPRRQVRELAEDIRRLIGDQLPHDAGLSFE